MFAYPAHQYELVKSARGALLAYCATVALPDLVRPLASFGGRSMCQVLVHVAETYHNWLGTLALRRPPVVLAAERGRDMLHLRRLYNDVDTLVTEFAHRFSGRWDETVTRTVAGQARLVSTTPLELFTHVLTHEFHHKGQVLSMSRQLGYEPVDTDIIRLP